jgi:mannosylfructose-6-phosphate phosphatase
VERLAMLVSDLDGTLLGDDDALEKFRTSFAALRPHFRLAYSSGRFVESVQSSIHEFRLPRPDAIICGVGTEMYFDSGELRSADWPKLNGRWDPVVVRAACEAFGSLRLQPTEFLSDHKISYYGEDLDQDCLTALTNHLSESGMTTSIVYSSARDLDVLPGGIDKGAAAAFLAEQWGVDRERTIVAGDSGNDTSMYQHGFCGIVVANAQPELQVLRGRNIYHSRQCFAAGVCEGIAYWRDKW